jgi:hypothetical protein
VNQIRSVAVVEGGVVTTITTTILAPGLVENAVTRLDQFIGEDAISDRIVRWAGDLQEIARRVTDEHLHRTVGQPADLSPGTDIDGIEGPGAVEDDVEVVDFEADMTTEGRSVLPFGHMKLLGVVDPEELCGEVEIESRQGFQTELVPVESGCRGKIIDDQGRMIDSSHLQCLSSR